MAINAKVTYIFSEERNGWSETWYIKDAQDLREAHATAKDMASYRQQLLAPGCNLEAYRTSDDAIRGDSLLSTYTKTSKGGTATGGQYADNPWNCWLVTVRSTELYRRALWLRGAADDWMTFDVDTNSWNVDQQMQKKLALFAAMAKESKFAIKALARDEATAPKKAITAFGALAAGKMSITVTGHGVTGTEKVTITGVQGSGNANLVNGIHAVLAQDTNTLQILDVNFLEVPAYYGGGVLRRRVNGFYVVNSMEALRPGKRDTGRRFFVTRGRRAKRKA